MSDHEDFSHLDDPDPHSLGTDHQLAAARNRGRVIARHTRRNRLAAGSAAVAATAGVAAVAVVGLPGRSVAGTAAGSPASPYPIPTPTASSSPRPAPAPATAATTAATTATVSAVPTPASSAQPYPSPSVAVTVPANGTVSPTPMAVPTATISATAATVAPTVSASPTAAPTVSATRSPSPTPLTSDCAKVTAALRTTPLPTGFTPLVPPSGVVSWYHAGAPLKSVVVTVACHPFDPSQVDPGLAVKEVTVLDAHSWLIGDPATGKLALTWNATDSTAVTVAAQVTLPETTGQVEDQLLTFGNMLIT